MNDLSPALALIGCGSTFDNIRTNWSAIAGNRALHVLPLASTDNAAADTISLLKQLDARLVRVFIAIDQQALNHARLDVYAQARLLGFRSDTLVHPTAIVAANVKLGENCWIGAGTLIGHDARIGNNSLVGDACRIDGHATIGANCWLGAGSSVGSHTGIGTHCVIGCDVKLGPNLHIGRHCSIDVPGHYSESLPDGSYIDPLFTLPVRIYGMATGQNAQIPQGSIQ